MIVISRFRISQKFVIFVGNYFPSNYFFSRVNDFFVKCTSKIHKQK